MKFNFFGKYIAGTPVEKYISDVLEKFLSELQHGLGKLNLVDNVDGFNAGEIVFSPNQTVTIRNKLGVIPSGYLVTRQRGIGQIIEPDDLIWSVDNVYLKNSAGNTVTAAIYFLR